MAGLPALGSTGWLLLHFRYGPDWKRRQLMVQCSCSSSRSLGEAWVQGHDSNCWELLRLECPEYSGLIQKPADAVLGRKIPPTPQLMFFKLHKPENETGTGPESPLTKGIKRQAYPSHSHPQPMQCWPL